MWAGLVCLSTSIYIMTGVEINMLSSRYVGPTIANISLPEAISTCPKNKLSTVGPAAACIKLSEKNERAKSQSFLKK